MPKKSTQNEPKNVLEKEEYIETDTEDQEETDRKRKRLNSRHLVTQNADF